MYFGRTRRGDHKLNKLRPDARIVPYVLRSFNELSVTMANTNRYKNSVIPWCLLHCQLGDIMVFITLSKRLNIYIMHGLTES